MNTEKKMKIHKTINLLNHKLAKPNLDYIYIHNVGMHNLNKYSQNINWLKYKTINLILIRLWLKNLCNRLANRKKLLQTIALVEYWIGII